MYREVSVKVKWDNNLSKKVDVALGIRQKAKLSTMLYKRYNNNILEALAVFREDDFSVNPRCNLL
jgi:hypothetical protein